MKTRYLWAGGLLVAGLLVLTAATGGQPIDIGVKKDAPRDPTQPPNIQLPQVIDPPLVVANPMPPVQQMQTIDQLIDSLTDIRAKKAELDKQEQVIISAIREKLKTQRERLNKIGVGEEAPLRDFPDKIEPKKFGDLPDKFELKK